jgi:hypothetical protein
MNSKLSIVWDVSDGEVIAALFLRLGLERALMCHATETWTTDVRSLEEVSGLLGGDVLLEELLKHRERLLLELPHCLMLISVDRPSGTTPRVTTEISSASRSVARLQMAHMKELLPEVSRSATDQVSVRFWSRGGAYGARPLARDITAPTWPEVAGNYPTSTRTALEPLMTDLDRVAEGGRLILWHGPPGTGKTFALRALVRAHADGLSAEYLLDPDSMFGQNARYFTDVLFNDDEESDKARLLVLEDCDELLSADAKARAGQGLARLLNLVDGLIGQGLRLYVLITTNEPMTRFHPAVSRPGRCGALISFEPFASEEAAKWLAEHDAEAEAPERASLAELYALVGKRLAPARPAPIGFQPIRS